MLKITHIRKVFKLCSFDPKNIGTEWHIAARDMTHVAHTNRAKQLITFYLEGAKDISVLYTAIWHLACGLALYTQEANSETVGITRREAAGSKAGTKNN